MTYIEKRTPQGAPAGPRFTSAAMPRPYDSILDTVGNTPIVRVNNIGPRNVNLYVKLEAFNPLGSVKDRLALGVIEAAERAGALKPGQTVIEATSGNTGIGLAMVCAQKGYPLVVTMAESFSIERRKLLRFLGAKHRAVIDFRLRVETEDRRQVGFIGFADGNNGHGAPPSERLADAPTWPALRRCSQ